MADELTSDCLIVYRRCEPVADDVGSIVWQTAERMPRCLIVEDDPEMAALERFVTQDVGFETHTVANLSDARTQLLETPYALLLLDLELPDGQGQELIRWLQAQPSMQKPRVLVLTASESQEIDCLLEGADDFVSKPVAPERLRARLVAQLRQLTIDDGLVLDPMSHEVRIDGARLELTKAEFEILRALNERPGWVLSRDQLLESVNARETTTPRVIDAHIKSLRAKLGESRNLIETVRGAGYRLTPQSAL